MLQQKKGKKSKLAHNAVYKPGGSSRVFIEGSGKHPNVDIVKIALDQSQTGEKTPLGAWC